MQDGAAARVEGEGRDDAKRPDTGDVRRDHRMQRNVPVLDAARMAFVDGLRGRDHAALHRMGTRRTAEVTHSPRQAEMGAETPYKPL